MGSNGDEQSRADLEEMEMNKLMQSGVGRKGDEQRAEIQEGTIHGSRWSMQSYILYLSCVQLQPVDHQVLSTHSESISKVVHYCTAITHSESISSYT